MVTYLVGETAILNHIYGSSYFGSGGAWGACNVVEGNSNSITSETYRNGFVSGTKTLTANEPCIIECLGGDCIGNGRRWGETVEFVLPDSKKGRELIASRKNQTFATGRIRDTIDGNEVVYEFSRIHYTRPGAVDRVRLDACYIWSGQDWVELAGWSESAYTTEEESVLPISDSEKAIIVIRRLVAKWLSQNVRP